MSQRFLAHAGAALAALFCSCFAFWPAFDNGFWGDDFIVLEQASAVDRDPATLRSRWVGSFDRPLAQTALYVQYSLWGLRPRPYLTSQVLLHVVNATLLFALFRGPLGAPVAWGAAVLFALALGFYGSAVLQIAAVGRLLATTFVLGTGIVALRAQLERTSSRRLAATMLTALLFFLALLSHESGVMALVMLGGLMWPHRRSLSSVARKLALLVVIAVLYLGMQLLGGEAQWGDATAWLRVPLRALHLAGLMVFPVEPAKGQAAATLLQRILTLIDQTRPILGLVILAAAAVWFWRAGGAVRWLLASYLAFLLGFPQAVAHPELGEAYLPAAFLCGTLAMGFRQLWLRLATVGRVGLAIVLLLALQAALTHVRSFETEADAAGRSAASRERLLQLQSGLARRR